MIKEWTANKNQTLIILYLWPFNQEEMFSRILSCKIKVKQITYSKFQHIYK